MNSNWSVYILLCADSTLYTGVTNNLDKRIEAHNLGRGAKYTKGRGPVKLVYRESGVNRSTALIREAQIKKMSRSEKMSLISLS